MREILGGKGAGLAEMCRAGLPVPPGFTISTEAGRLFAHNPEQFRGDVLPEVEIALQGLEGVTGKRFGSPEEPLLLSVRSGASVSMPGMMDTVLNVGLNDVAACRWAEVTSDPSFVYDCYRRLLEMFGEVVLAVPRRRFERILALRQQGKELCREFAEMIESEKKSFPQDPREQLLMAMEAVFRSWNNPRAVAYRRLNDIPEDLGSAVSVQMMVFGNRGKDSGTGVGFTRDPSTGERRLYGEFLPEAQGEEVVAGRRTPLGLDQLERNFPEVYRQLQEATAKLERLRREMQNVEFTLQEGKLYFLQTRDGQRTGRAAVRIAWDMHREGLLSREEAILRVEPRQLEQLLYPVFKETAGVEILGQGLPASPGAAVGKIAFSAEDAVHMTQNGEPVILVRRETTSHDIQGIEVAEGIFTARGGMTSHAAVIARGLGKCCVVGCESLEIDEENRELSLHDRVLRAGEFISVDGYSGRVMAGKVEKIASEFETGLLTDYRALLEGIARVSVRAHADSVSEARKARGLGASGIGLCRTEHMFFAEGRPPVIQEMMISHSARRRNELLARLKEFQKADFLGILEVMDGLPVTVRLLDPSSPEFLPCRLGIAHPEITRAQVSAFFEAACELKKTGKSPVVEVMIPPVSLVEEFRDQEGLVREVAEEVFKHHQLRLAYLVGAMIELPRAALVAGQIARHAEFFSLGTHDLTQTTFGWSRPDAAKSLRRHPFAVLDPQGVGELIRTAVETGRKVRPDLKLGLCGDQAADPAAIQFCHDLGIDYVSCAPQRVPAARLAAAQAALHYCRTRP